MDVIDPRPHDLTDAGAKWAALARYATDHPDRVRRALAFIRDASGALRALDLTADGIDENVAMATDKDLMEAVFAAEGMTY
jgi:type III restriction enzyme